MESGRRGRERKQNVSLGGTIDTYIVSRVGGE